MDLIGYSRHSLHELAGAADVQGSTRLNQFVLGECLYSILTRRRIGLSYTRLCKVLSATRAHSGVSAPRA